MRVYISGKITDNPKYKEQFTEAQTRLESIGHEVINPARAMDSFPKSTTWAEYMVVALAMLDMCDGIYMLDGWTTSRGAKIEKETAEKDGKAVFIMGEFEPEPTEDYLKKIELLQRRAAEKRQRLKDFYGDVF